MRSYKRSDVEFGRFSLSDVIFDVSSINDERIAYAVALKGANRDIQQNGFSDNIEAKE